jgi:tetratricopeptide (TPR) repeat protein
MSTLHKRFTRKYSNGLKKEKHQQSHSSIFLDSSDQSRALYYLGLTYHLKAKELLCSNGGVLNDHIRTLLNKSCIYYEQNLDLNKELNDKVAEGRTLGNIGNVNYLLQDYSTSIEYLEKRLTIAKECNDQAGQRRAHGNLGNAYLYLEDSDKALHHYREAMNIGESMNDESFIARMNFTIGRVYGLKQDYDTAIYFHEKHLNLARQLEDSIGQCRAYYFLSQLNEKINQYDKAKKYDSLYKALAREIDQPTEDTISMSTRSGPTNNLLKNLRTDSISISLSEGGGTNNVSSTSSSHSPYSARSNASVSSSITDVRSFTGSTDDKSLLNKRKKSKSNSQSLRTNLMHHLGKKSPIPIRKEVKN